MGKPRANPRLAKIHRNYTVEEIVTLYGVHRNTVRQWIKAGLPLVDQRRPVLVLGAALADFLRKRRSETKRPCRLGEIYCVRCREPRVPANGLVRYHPTTPSRGRLVGLCPVCSAGLHRSVNAASLAGFEGLLRIALPLAAEHIGERQQALANSDFTQEAPAHANAPS